MPQEKKVSFSFLIEIQVHLLFLLVPTHFLSFCCVSDWKKVEADCRKAIELDKSSLKVK
jgi:hypothetical protein